MTPITRHPLLAALLATPFASLRDRIRASCARSVRGSAGWGMTAK